MATTKQELVEIKAIKWKRAECRIIGDTPLIEHAWSHKAKQMMLEVQMGKAKGKKKEFKNPVEDFINSLYWLTPMPTEYTEEAFEKAIAEGAKFGFPITGIKQAGISAAYRKNWVKNMASLRGAFFLESDYVSESGDQMVVIEGDAPVMREDMVKIGQGTADIRYRGMFNNWSAKITIKYDANGGFDLNNILNIINAGGSFCGIGEWRPERDGQYGMYHIEMV